MSPSDVQPTEVEDSEEEALGSLYNRVVSMKRAPNACPRETQRATMSWECCGGFGGFILLHPEWPFYRPSQLMKISHKKPT